MSTASRLAGPAMIGIVAIAAYELEAPAWIAIAARVTCGAWLAVEAFVRAKRRIDAIAVGVLLAGVADAVLAFSTGSAGRFVLAMGIFAAGHLAFAKGLWRLAPVGHVRAIATLLPLVAYAVGVLLVLWPSLGALRGPVIAYVAILTAMCWRACLAAQRPADGTARAAYAIAGLLFVLADTALAVHRFCTPIPHSKLIALAPYWVSLAAFVSAIAAQPSESIHETSAAGGSGGVPE